MKKILFLLAFIISSTALFAKKVKFACDMTGTPVLATGMHISGDFQDVAGFIGGDWNSSSTSLTQEPGTEIYSIIVDIPAFQKYEYKFVNGDQFYDAEFVPEYSRVGYNFNDNRWIYVDSTANDTTFVGAIMYAGNAPAGMTLVRFYVDMQSTTVSPNGVHLAGNFQGWNPSSTILYSFGDNIYEVISYVTNGTYEYRFYNGNTGGAGETVPGACQVNGNREITVTEDVLVDMVCYESCGPCVTGIAENAGSVRLNIYPNPATSFVTLNVGNLTGNYTIRLCDIAGSAVRVYERNDPSDVKIDTDNLDRGVYLISIFSGNGTGTSAKLILE